ncbi:fibrinogen alpha chain-like [Salvelinus namaycush]|uniref:Fibrinogen alpha chain-like n=1 Tax=Salvelinus namaycush TaxID=8040 RepID=A0A8U0PTB6_SALNM|nr:fibrinogen alpha chain-like [Salvelinus namaycush]
MKLLHILCFCLAVLASTWAEDVATVLSPRGTRPVEHGYKADKCATERSWPFCSDDDWGPKCPSGCRIQGLLDKADHSLLKKIEKIRQLLDQNRAKHRSADQASKQTYDYLKEKLTSNAGNDNSFYDLAERLRQRIVDIKIKIDRQLRILNTLKTSIKDQVIEMQRMEVDIDIKLRSCKGSCKGYAEFSVDQTSYVALDKQMDQLEAQRVQSVETVGSLHIMKSRPLKDVLVDSKFKSSLSGEQKQDFFPEVKSVKLTLEAEGSSASSAATVSKVPGTHFQPSTSGSSSSSSSSSSWSTGSGSKDGPKKTITELGGGGGGGGTRGDGDGDFFKGLGGLGGGLGSLGGGDFTSTGHQTTQISSCTKTIKKTTVHTKDGPVERIEEVSSGPGCEAMKLGGGGGGIGDFFPSSSSSFTKTTSHGSSKGGSSLLSSTKTGGAADGFGADSFGMDLGAFMRGNEDDDVPDFHSQTHGVKTSVRSKRQAGYVGKSTSDQE